MAKAGVTNVWISFHPWHAAAAEMESYKVLPSLNIFFFQNSSSFRLEWEKWKKFFFSTRLKPASKETCYRVKKFVKEFSGKKSFEVFWGKIPSNWKVRYVVILKNTLSTPVTQKTANSLASDKTWRWVLILHLTRFQQVFKGRIRVSYQMRDKSWQTAYSPGPEQ